MVEPTSRPGMPGRHRTRQQRAVTAVIAAPNVAALGCVVAGLFMHTDALNVAAVLALVALVCTAVAVWRKAASAYWLIPPILHLGVVGALWVLVAIAVSEVAGVH